MRPKGTHPPSRGRLAVLRDHEVRRWYDKKVVRSRVTGDEYARKLAFILERLGLDAESVVTEASQDPDRLEDRLVAYAREQKGRGRLDNYIRKSLNGLRSFLSFRRVAFNRWPEVSPVQGASLENERVPRPEELDRVLGRLSPRGRVIALMMAHAGVRPGVLGGYRGATGLTLGDLPELRLGKKVEFDQTPFVIRVPAALSKTKVAYTSFGTRQLGTAIAAELERRKEAGEKLGPASPLVAAHKVRGIAATSRRGAEYGGTFLCTNAVTEEIRNALDSTAPEGVHWRVYVLRSYCSTRLLLAEGDGRISRDLAQSILGHSTGVAGRYHVGKKWGEELLAEARKEYAAAAEFLETHVRQVSDIRSRLLADLAVAVENASGRKAGSTLSGEDLAKAIRDILGGSAESSKEGTELPVTVPNGRPGEQKVVDADAVDRYLDSGWTFKSPLNGSKAVVEWVGALHPSS